MRRIANRSIALRRRRRRSSWRVLRYKLTDQTKKKPGRKKNNGPEVQRRKGPQHQQTVRQTDERTDRQTDRRTERGK